MMKFLTAHEEQQLLDAACSGDVEARNSVIMNVYSIVRSTVGKRFVMSDSEREDAIQYVISVLCEKFHKFDVTRKLRFMTYANFWVRYALQQFMIKRQLIQFRENPVAVISIEPVSDGTECLRQEICAPNSSPAHDMELVDDLTELKRVVDRLHPKDREVVIRRSQGEKLQSIADSLGLSRERVRQIELKALQRMRYWFQV